MTVRSGDWLGLRRRRAAGGATTRFGVLAVTAMLLIGCTGAQGESPAQSEDATPSVSSSATETESAAPSQDATAGDPVTIRWGTVLPAEHPTGVAADRAAEILDERTDGRITIETFPAGQLGASREMLESLKFGSLEMQSEGAGVAATFFEQLSLFDMPILYESFDHLEAVFQSDLGQGIVEGFAEDQGIRVLDIWYYGTEHITANRPIETPADMDGLKIRVPENAPRIAWAEAMGMSPTPMAFGEVYLALQTNAVDAQANPLPTIDAGKFQEVQDYLILSGHAVVPIMPMVSEEFWTGLSADDQALILDVVQEVGDEHGATIVEQEESLLPVMEEAGMTVITPDRAPFIEAMGAVWEDWEDIWGDGVAQQVLDAAP